MAVAFQINLRIVNSRLELLEQLQNDVNAVVAGYITKILEPNLMCLQQSPPGQAVRKYIALSGAQDDGRKIPLCHECVDGPPKFHWLGRRVVKCRT